MPRFDGTGPAGEGPMTGRGLGFCILKSQKKGDNSGIWGYAGLDGAPVSLSAREPAPDREPRAVFKSNVMELDMLKRQIQALAERAEGIRERILELEKQI